MKIISIPIIVTIIYVLYVLVKKPLQDNKKIMNFLPIIVALIGGILAVIIFFTIPSIVPAKNFLDAFLMGVVSGLTSIGSNSLISNIKEDIKENKVKAKDNENITKEEKNNEIEE